MASTTRPLPPLVDREVEMARIADALDAAERGEGQLLLLRGEAGCGKTRLAQEAAVEAERRGFASGFGTSLAESVASCHPWMEAFRDLTLGHVLEEGPPPKLLGLYVTTATGSLISKVERTTQRPSVAVVAAVRTLALGGVSRGQEPTRDGPFSVLALDQVRVVDLRSGAFHVSVIFSGREDEALLSDLLGLARELEAAVKAAVGGEARKDARRSLRTTLRRLLDAGKYEGVDYARDDPKLRQARIFDMVVWGLHRKAESRPQLVVIDDLQWADPTSLALLQHVARNTRKERVLLVGTYRVEEAGVRPPLRDFLAKMGLEGQPAGLLVSGIPRDETRRLAEAFLGSHALPNDFLDLLWRETQGYPLFIREVLRGLEEEGVIGLRAGMKRLDRATEGLAIPVRVREAIGLRLERLPRNERRLLEAAATCGTRFTSALLAKVAGEDESRVTPNLDSLVRVHGLLRATQDGFAFDHPAVHEVVYSGVDEESRRAYHRAAAEWLELVGGPVEEIAEHFYAARDRRGVPPLRRAADAASRRYANQEALRLWGEASELTADEEERAALLAAKGRVLELVGDPAEALRAYRAASQLSALPSGRGELLARIGRVLAKQGKHGEGLEVCGEALALTKGSNSQEEALALQTSGVVHSDHGDYTRAVDYLERALAVCQRIGDDHGAAASLSSLGIVWQRRGDYTRALDYLEQAVAMTDEASDARNCGNYLNNVGVIHSERGELDRALEFYNRALAIRERTGDAEGLAGTLNNIGVVLRKRGDYDRALEHYMRGLAIAEKIGHSLFAGNMLDNIGLVFRDRGDYDRALEYQQRGLAIRQATADEYGIVQSLNNLGFVFRERGDHGKALEFSERALAIAEKIGMDPGVVESLGNIAEVHLALGEYDKALGIVRRAIGVAVRVRSDEFREMMLRIQGMIQRERRRWPESIRSFEESLQICRDAGFALEGGRAHYEFGRMWDLKGEGERARLHLVTAVEDFSRIGADKDLALAREALEGLRSRRRSRGPRRRGRLKQDCSGP